MSLPVFVRSGRWIVNPRRVIAVSQRAEPDPTEHDLRTLIVLDDGFKVELTGQEAVDIWRIFTGLVPAAYSLAAGEPDGIEVVLLGGDNPRPAPMDLETRRGGDGDTTV